MSYCPNCRVEFGESATQCKKCGVTLLPGDLPEAASPEAYTGETICLGTFSGPTAQMEADLAKSVLEEQGIPAVVAGVSTAGGVEGGSEGVTLWVLQEDADEAADILEDFFDSPPTPSPDEPSM